MCASLLQGINICVAHTLHSYFALSFFYVCEISFLLCNSPCHVHLPQKYVRLGARGSESKSKLPLF